jgi:hypothetical protein
VLFGRHTTTKYFEIVLTRHEARWIAANVAKLRTRYNLPRRYSIAKADSANATNAKRDVIRNGHGIAIPIDSHAWSPPNSDA